TTAGRRSMSSRTTSAEPSQNRPRVTEIQGWRESPSLVLNRRRGIGTAGQLGGHLVHTELGPEAPRDLVAAEDGHQLWHLIGEPEPEHTVEPAHEGAPRRTEERGHVSDVADLVAQDLVVEKADARGDRGLVREQRDPAVPEGTED